MRKETQKIPSVGQPATDEAATHEAEIRLLATAGMDQWADGYERRYRRVQYAGMVAVLLALPAASYAVAPRPTYRSFRTTAMQTDAKTVCEQSIVTYQKAIGL